jgi:energy coupling factor transporter S component ThiW
MIGVFTALGFILSFFYIPILTSKAYPAQHMINALAGVLLGPLDAVLIAFLVGVFRNMLGVGTVYAFPGGLPGAFIVGVSYIIFRRVFGGRKAMKLAVWTEPIGTVLIGATLSIYIVAPWIGQDLSGGGLLGILTLYGGWSLSSFSGVIIAFIVLLVLEGSGLLEKLGK